MARMNDFLERMRELYRELEHCQTTGQYNKAAFICEEQAEMWLAVHDRGQATESFAIASDSWWRHGRMLKEKMRKDEALKAFNRALRNCDLADKYGFFSTFQALATKAEIEREIKEL